MKNLLDLAIALEKKLQPAKNDRKKLKNMLFNHLENEKKNKQENNAVKSWFKMKSKTHISSGFNN